MKDKFKHKCPDCGKFHVCNMLGNKHLITCPLSGKEIEIQTGRLGRQIK